MGGQAEIPKGYSPIHGLDVSAFFVFNVGCEGEEFGWAVGEEGVMFSSLLAMKKEGGERINAIASFI